MNTLLHTAVWLPTESTLKGGFFSLSALPNDGTKGNRIEPSPCNAGIMVKLSGLSAACVLCCAEWGGYACREKEGRCCLYLLSPALRVPAALALQTCLWRMGNCHMHAEVRIWIEWTGALSGSSCQSLVDPTVHPPTPPPPSSSSAPWSALTLGLCECHSVLAVKPFLKQTVT